MINLFYYCTMGLVAFAVVGFFYAGLGKWFWAFIAWVVVSSVWKVFWLDEQKNRHPED